MNAIIARVVDQLHAGMPSDLEVWGALGWETRQNVGRIAHAKRNPFAEQGQYARRWHSALRVTLQVDDALDLIKSERVEEAMAVGLALERPFASTAGLPSRGVLARRVCVVALTRPDLLNPEARARPRQ
jgi:hypothetical protein